MLNDDGMVKALKAVAEMQMVDDTPDELTEIIKKHAFIEQKAETTEPAFDDLALPEQSYEQFLEKMRGSKRR